MNAWMYLLGWFLVFGFVALLPFLYIGGGTLTLLGAAKVGSNVAKGDRNTLKGLAWAAGILTLLLVLNLQYYDVLPPRADPAPPAAPARPGPRELIVSRGDVLQAARLAASGRFEAIYLLSAGELNPQGEDRLASGRLGAVERPWAAERIAVVRTSECLTAINGARRLSNDLAARCVQRSPAAWTGTGPARPMYFARSDFAYRRDGPGLYELWLKQDDRLTLVRRCGDSDLGAPRPAVFDVGGLIARARDQRLYKACLEATQAQLRSGRL